MSEQFDLFNPPPADKPRARSTDPETSHKAPATVDRDEIQKMILDVSWSAGSFTHFHMVGFVNRRRKLAGRTPLEPSTVRSRVSELVKQGLIRDTGVKETVYQPGKKRASKMIVWELTPLGTMRCAELFGRRIDRKLVA
jgi:hypothetical protein